MIQFALVVIISLLASLSSAAELPKTEEEKTLYAIGLTVSQQLSVFSITPAELGFVIQGIRDSGSGKKPEVELSAYTTKIQELARARRKVQGDKLAVVNKDFLDKIAKEKGAIKTDSGLVYLSLKEGNGASPKSADTVKVNYRGSLPDGKEFDSTYKRGAPLELKLDRVIKCWSEGLQKMKPGGKARLACPPALAYGDTGVGDVILPGAALAFDVELLEVKPEAKSETKPETKPDVKPGGGEKK
jgi:FKBP-type peptidyl-prolyl cis-trans isomerase FkpA